MKCLCKQSYYNTQNFTITFKVGEWHQYTSHIHHTGRYHGIEYVHDDEKLKYDVSEDFFLFHFYTIDEVREIEILN